MDSKVPTLIAEAGNPWPMTSNSGYGYGSELFGTSFAEVALQDTGNFILLVNAETSNFNIT